MAEQGKTPSQSCSLELTSEARTFGANEAPPFEERER
jgi:hypothetical protein